MRKFYRAASLCVATMLAVVGCEFDSTGTDGGYNDDLAWADFSGIYRPASGQNYVVSDFTGTPGTDGETVEAEEVVAVGNGIDSTFSTTLDNAPISVGSLTVYYGDESLVDPEGDGTLSGGGLGASGTINYETGTLSVEFAGFPAPDEEVIANYLYYREGTAENPSPGSTDEIRSLTVSQQGSALTIVDSNGGQYTGQIITMSTPGGLISNVTASSVGFEVTATFEVNGISVSGVGVTIVGTFQGEYTDEPGTMSDFIYNRGIQGTWIEDNGRTGNIVGYASDIAVQISNSYDTSGDTTTTTGEDDGG